MHTETPDCDTCQKCGDEIEDTAHLIEAFEISNGLLLCSCCFDEICEKDAGK